MKFWCDHSNENYWAVLSRGTDHYTLRDGCKICVSARNPVMEQLKWTSLVVLSLGTLYTRTFQNGTLDFRRNWFTESFISKKGPQWLLSNCHTFAIFRNTTAFKVLGCPSEFFWIKINGNSPECFLMMEEDWFKLNKNTLVILISAGPWFMKDNNHKGSSSS